MTGAAVLAGALQALFGTPASPVSLDDRDKVLQVQGPQVGTVDAPLGPIVSKTLETQHEFFKHM